MIAHI